MALIIPLEIIEQFQAMPHADAVRVRQALEQVASDITQRLPFVTEMVGQPGVWRLRKGNLRAIYEVVGNDVRVARVSHRKDAYE